MVERESVGEGDDVNGAVESDAREVARDGSIARVVGKMCEAMVAASMDEREIESSVRDSY